MIILETFPLTQTQKLYVSSVLNTKQQRNVEWVNSTDRPDVVITSKDSVESNKQSFPNAKLVLVKGNNVTLI